MSSMRRVQRGGQWQNPSVVYLSVPGHPAIRLERNSGDMFRAMLYIRSVLLSTEPQLSQAPSSLQRHRARDLSMRNEFGRASTSALNSCACNPQSGSGTTSRSTVGSAMPREVNKQSAGCRVGGGSPDRRPGRTGLEYQQHL